MLCQCFFFSAFISVLPNDPVLLLFNLKMEHTEHIAAEVLYNAAQFKTVCNPVREIIGDLDIDLAYRVQEINIKKRIDNGDVVVGKKIGLTSFAVQKQLGVDQPDYGMLMKSTQVKDGGKLAFNELMQPKAEAEIAFVMKSDLDGEITMERLIDSIDYAVASIEIVGSRVEKWDIKITDTVADNASASHFVLGTEKHQLEDIDLVNCKMTMTKNDAVVSEGTGEACMGNPLNAGLWLAQVMAKKGHPLQKGEILLSGALGPMVNIGFGDSINTIIQGLGEVCVDIT
ncbi:MAG: 2-keto-4-pentenoate hydratase [Bacteroidia bacterium]|jgi:2-keto-4-pentenoate hydratase